MKNNNLFNKLSLVIIASIIIIVIIIGIVFYNKKNYNKIINNNIENFKEYLNNDENNKKNENKVKQESFIKNIFRYFYKIILSDFIYFSQYSIKTKNYLKIIIQ